MRSNPREIETQEDIVAKLDRLDIHPYSIICSFAIGEGIISITFYLKQDLSEFLDLLSYRSQCDKTGYLVMEDNNTIILSGLALINLYTLL